MQAAAEPLGQFRAELRRLFYGHRPLDITFQVGLLLLDLGALAYFLATTFVTDAAWIGSVDLVLGILLLLEFLGRLAAHRHPMHYLDNASALVDVIVIVSLFASAVGGNLPDFEETSRALFAGDLDRLDSLTGSWPADVRDHLRTLARRGADVAGEGQAG
mgnify:CR=1 FL=1